MSDNFKPIETQEQLNEVIGGRLEKQRKSIEEKFTDEISALRSQLEEKETALTELGSQLNQATTERDGFSAQIAELQGKVQRYETSSVKMRIAQEYGLDAQLANRLSGESEEEIREDAKALKDIVGQTNMIRVPLKSTEPEGTNNRTEALKNMLNSMKGE